MNKEIFELEAGTKIKLLSLADHDGHYFNEKDLINKNYEAFNTHRFSSTAFRQEGTSVVYVFASGATYEIIKKQPA